MSLLRLAPRGYAFCGWACGRMLDCYGRCFGALWGNFFCRAKEDSFCEAAGERHDVLRAGGEKSSILHPHVQNREIHDSELQEQRHDPSCKRAQYRAEE